jgi:uncharacterized protein YodC (DUF2158 family)
MNLKVGDIVSLNYNIKGPDMTVSELTSPNEVTCLWFDDLDKLHEGVFPIATLELEYNGEEEEAT